MSVVPPENTDKLEHEKQREADAYHVAHLHDQQPAHERHSTSIEHREHAPSGTAAGLVHEKAHPADAVNLAHEGDSEKGSGHLGNDGIGMQTKTVWTFKTLVATMALSGLYVGSQIPLYFCGGSLSFIAKDIGGTETSAWLSVSYALALSAVAPFCGYLQDLLGRRIITLGGGISLMMGCIILATAHQFGQGIVGMSFAGAGAAIGELTALAG
jgi:hypothetical protein